MKRTLLAGMIALTMGAAVAGPWVKYGDEPVLGDTRLGTCFDINVVTNGPAPYTMYFSWRPRKSIALVRSNDALTWTQEPEFCLRENPASGWEDIVNRCCVVKKDGVWHMWYTGQCFREKYKGRIGYARSKDGVHFERVRKDPVLVATEPYELPTVMCPHVLWDEKRQLWRMWYSVGNTYEPDRICYAESKDGFEWKKWPKNPMFAHGPRESWYRDRVAGNEVHQLPDGRFALFFCGYPDMDTGHVGCAISPDGINDWKVIDQSPLVIPDPGTWDSSSCYKSSVLRDEKNNRWLLWYNGRSGGPEYVGCVMHEGLDLEAPPERLPDPGKLLSTYVRRFNVNDDETVANAVPNAAAEKFLAANVPLFACPDREIERTYYFRWWTFRKHLRSDLGLWTVSEYLPQVGSAGPGNTTVGAAGHHFREGRWLRNPRYIADDARFWLTSTKAAHRRNALAWLYTGACSFAEVAGLDDLPRELLDDAVQNYRQLEKGVQHGEEPLFNATMWSEANAIAKTAKACGRYELALEFEIKASVLAKTLRERCWNPELKFFAAEKSAARELSGYAPWYFGAPVEGCAPDWEQLFDEKGFGARYGLSFLERRAKGFSIDYSKVCEDARDGSCRPFATSIALTAYMNDLHARARKDGESERFTYLMWQYAFAHKLHRTPTNPVGRSFDPTVPWIDENYNPDKPDWIIRRVRHEEGREPLELGKDCNQSTFCDMVISGLVGFMPEGEDGFSVDPLCPAKWDYFVLDNLRYRGHDVSIRWHRGRGLTVKVDGGEAARSQSLSKVRVRFEKPVEMAAGKYPYAPVALNDVKVTGGFWLPRIETNRLVTVRTDFAKCEETGRIANFEKAGRREKGGFKGVPWDDSDVYKVIEGAAYTLAQHPDAELDRYLDGLIAKIASAQESDGYLYTARTLGHNAAMMGPKPFSRNRDACELYNVGHLYEAAVAHYEVTGKRALLDVAIKNADLVAKTFGLGEGQSRETSGHEEIEIGLCRLYQATGDKKYLKLAQHFIDMRGRKDLRPIWGAAYQDHVPVLMQKEALGHAVRAAYLYSGMADVAALAGNAAYVKAIDGLWENVVGRKLHLSGGIGVRRHVKYRNPAFGSAHEAFGDDYDLQNLDCYLETCAAIGNALWNERMFLLHGDAKYIDVMERTLYNGLISGVSIGGDEFFYPNPLATKGGYKRSKWFSCSCCPVNVVRFTPQVGRFAYATRDNAAYVNLFMESEATLKLASGDVKLSQHTAYPWNGASKITVADLGCKTRNSKPETRNFTLNIRVPGWCVGKPVPSDLYSQVVAGTLADYRVKVNGRDYAFKPEKGYCAITREWKAGDVVEIAMNMPVRRITANEKVWLDRGYSAVERGPLVYCAEAVDNGGKAFFTVLPVGATFTEGEIEIASTKMVSLKGGGLTLVPYFAWCHRGAGEMQTWFAERPDLLRFR